MRVSLHLVADQQCPWNSTVGKGSKTLCHGVAKLDPNGDGVDELWFFTLLTLFLLSF